MCSLQVACHQAVYGLSLCVSTLVDLIVAAECSTGPHPGRLDFSQIDLNGRGIIGQDAQQTISVLVPTTKDVLQLFNSDGFYNIACAVVGQKNLDWHKAECPILERLSYHLQEENHAQFVCGSWVKDVCKRFFTNFANMWSPGSCFGDLRAVMELFLRTYLCSQRFFDPKTHHKDKKKNIDNKQTPASKHHTTIKLFEALVAKTPKKHVVDFFCNKLFVASAAPTTRPVSNAAEPIPDAADDDSNQEEDEDDKLFPLESPDLPAKDIRALVLVARNLCQSHEHPDVITANHVKDKLNHDKQETIPRATMELTARLIITARRITPKKGQPFSFATWFLCAQLTILKDKHTQDLDAVIIDALALYHLFSSEYYIYMANGVDKFASINADKTQEQQLDILSNFIRVNHIKNELGKRKLTFAGYFMFKNQYRLDFSVIYQK